MKPSRLFFGLLLCLAFRAFAQDKPARVDFSNMDLTTRKAFEDTYRKVALHGVITIPKTGQGKVALIDLAAAPKGFSFVPVCELTERGKPTVSVTDWEETDRTDFFSFRGKPGKAIEWKCVGWTRK